MGVRGRQRASWRARLYRLQPDQSTPRLARPRRLAATQGQTRPWRTPPAKGSYSGDPRAVTITACASRSLALEAFPPTMAASRRLRSNSVNASCCAATRVTVYGRDRFVPPEVRSEGSMLTSFAKDFVRRMARPTGPGQGRPGSTGADAIVPSEPCLDSGAQFVVVRRRQDGQLSP
jgi:hypothetical protein